MRPLGKATKDPNAIVPFTIDLSSWLASLTGESSIASAAWAIDDAPDAVLVIDSTTLSGTSAVAKVSAGTEGEVYRLRCRATTSPTGYVDDFTIVIEVLSR